MHLIVSFDIKR